MIIKVVRCLSDVLAIAKNLSNCGESKIILILYVLYKSGAHKIKIQYTASIQSPKILYHVFFIFTSYLQIKLL